MKTLTLAVIGAALFLSTLFIVMHHTTSSHTSTTETNGNAVWFNSIEIADGITVEFEYGTQMRVFVEGDKHLIPQLALVLENHVLKATGNVTGLPKNSIRIKVVTPVLVNLATIQNTVIQTAERQVKTSNPSVQMEPVFMQQNLFQVYTGKA